MNEVPHLTRDQVRRVDELAIRELGIPGLLLMENAGRNAATVVLELARARQATRIVVLAGAGNNGGDGFVIARHVANAGAQVVVYFLGEQSRLPPDAAVNFQILERMKLAVHPVETVDAARAVGDELRPDDLVVDALLGTGFQGTVREPIATVIHALNATRGHAVRAVVAVDLPSGLDADLGVPTNATVRADVTVTFVARKTGFRNPGAAEFTGEVRVVDIGAPRELIGRV